MAYSWEKKTLQELEGEDWGEAAYGSHVVTASHAIRLKPVGKLSTEELRLAIGQGMGLTYLLQVAIKRLEDDPLLSGDFYRGDLLLKVLQVPLDSWKASSLAYVKPDLCALRERAISLAEAMPDAWKGDHLEELISAFGFVCNAN